MTLQRCGVLVVALLASDVEMAGAQCTYSVSPTTVSAQSTGLTSSISVITGSSCAWTTTSAVPWITVTGGINRTGLGSASFVVAVNDTGAARTGTLNIAGTTVTINQATGSCSATVTPTSISAPMSGRTGTISVITGSACSWTATSTVGWIAITAGATGSGLGSANYNVSASSVARSGAINIAGQTIPVLQGTSSPLAPAPPANLRIVIVQ